MVEDIEEGIELFNSFDFFAAHDFFEDLWVEAKREKRLFYQGMVQVSVGSYHLINKNYKGALSQYIKGTEKLKKYVPLYMGINISTLLADVQVLISDLESFFLGKDVAIDLEKIPRIKKL